MNKFDINDEYREIILDYFESLEGLIWTQSPEYWISHPSEKYSIPIFGDIKDSWNKLNNPEKYSKEEGSQWMQMIWDKIIWIGDHPIDLSDLRFIYDLISIFHNEIGEIYNDNGKDQIIIRDNLLRELREYLG